MAVKASPAAAGPPSDAGRDALGRLDARLDRAYSRLGWRLPLVHQLASTALGAITALVVTLLLARIERLSGTETLQLAGLITALCALQAILGFVFTRRALAPLAAWFDGGRSSASAPEVWRVVHRLPFDLSRVSAVIGAVLTVPAMVAGTGMFIPLGPELLALALVFASVSIATIVGGGIFGLQLLLRPLIRDVADRMEAPPPPEGGTSVRLKLLVAIPLIALFAASIAVFLTVDPGAEWGGVLADTLLVMIVALLLVFPIAVLLAHSTMRPLDDLLEATRRLKRGEFETRVPELSGDEYGILARSFNEAMEGLAERQQLARANETLLEEVRASRARIIAASDAERRRVERNIHDGAQQQLVALALELRMMEELAESMDTPQLRALAAEASTTLKQALDDLRELARGLHPSVLVTDGLSPALEQLASRVRLPVAVEAPAERFPEAIESTAYFVASEALANVAKYSGASRAEVSVRRRNGRLLVEVSDDGVGGADVGIGSGLTGLVDRVAALDGRLHVESPSGQGTRVTAELPLERGAAA